ncbi:MAG: TonB-dependent receptor [Pseudomonadota bacterium]
MRYLKSKKFPKAALLALTSTVALGSAPVVVAQETSEQPISAIDLPAGPLQTSLVDLGEQLGVDVFASSNLVRGQMAPAISGTMSAEVALGRALAGSGLVANRGADGAYVISERRVAEDTQRRQPIAQVEEADDLLEEVDDPLVEDTIIVTGTKQDRSLFDTQTSAEVFTEERFEREVAFDFDDIIQRTPNVSSNGTTADITIRGINLQGAARGIGGGPTINIYVDGAPLTNFNGIESLWDVDQVELLRGPQSTIQGRNALAGAIIINTKDPTYDFEASAQARIGNNNLRQYSAAISGPLIKDQLAARLAVDFQDFEGDARQPVTGDPTEIQEGLTLRGKILAEPNAISGLRVDLQADYVDTEAGNLNFIAFPVPADDPSFDDFDPFGDINPGGPTLVSVETIRSVARIDYEVAPWLNLVGIGTYEDSDQSQIQGDLSDPVLFPFNGNFVIDTEAYSGELRAEFEQGVWSGWVGGYYYTDESTSGGETVFAISGFIPVVPDTSVGSATLFTFTERENYAFFGEVRYEPTDNWEFEFGLRYDNESFDQSSENTPLTVNPADCVVADFIPGLGGFPCGFIFPPTGDADPNQSATFDAVLPRGTITYNFDQDHSISFGAQRGYRAGGAFVRSSPDAAGTPQTVVGTFDPEFITNYEIAFRGRWLDERLTTLFNVFYSDWTDQQVRIPGPSGLPNDLVILNAGSSELYGAEFSLGYEVSDTLDLSFGVGLVETEFDDFAFAIDENGDPVNAANPKFANLAGNEFALSPDLTLSAGAYYENSRGFFGDATLNYTSNQFSDVENLALDEADDFTLVSVRAGYRTGQFEIYGFAENLFDERAILERRFAEVSTDTGDIEFAGSPSARINRPRAYGVGVRVDF